MKQPKSLRCGIVTLNLCTSQLKFPSLFDTDGYLISRSQEINFSLVLCSLSHSQYTDKEILKDSLIVHIFFRIIWLQKEDDHLTK